MCIDKMCVKKTSCVVEAFASAVRVSCLVKINISKSAACRPKIFLGNIIATASAHHNFVFQLIDGPLKGK